MSEYSVNLDYEEILEVDEPTEKRPILICSADRCNDMGTYENLCAHWVHIHLAHTLLCLCPVQGCRCKKMFIKDIWTHAQDEHGLLGEGLKASDAVPAVVQVVPNRNYWFPVDHSPLAVTQEVPEGTFWFSQKVHASVLLQEKLRAMQAASKATSTVAAPLVPPAPLALRVPQPPSLLLLRPANHSRNCHENLLLWPRTPFEWQNVMPWWSNWRHILGICHREVALWQERYDVLHRLERRSSSEIIQLRQHVQALQQRLSYVEGENRRLRISDREPRPVIVGHLDHIPSTGALVLNQFWPFYRQILCLLDLPSRTPCLSSDNFWIIMIQPSCKTIYFFRLVWTISWPKTQLHL